MYRRRTENANASRDAAESPPSNRNNRPTFPPHPSQADAFVELSVELVVFCNRPTFYKLLSGKW